MNFTRGKSLVRTANSVAYRQFVRATCQLCNRIHASSAEVARCSAEYQIRIDKELLERKRGQRS